MEAIVPAFLLAVLSQLGERPATLTAILADRFGRPFTVALAAGLAHLALNVAAGIAGAAMASMMTPNAQSLLLGVALISGAAGALWRIKQPGRHDAWKLGPLFTPLVAIFFVALGGQTQFFTLALATRGELWFAVAGASVGSFASAFVAAVLGEQQWAALPFRWIRLAAGIAFLIAGIWYAAWGLRLL